MTERKKRQIEITELMEAIDHPGWSPKERDVIRELASLKRLSKEQVGALTTLRWRLAEIRDGRHVRVKLPWES